MPFWGQDTFWPYHNPPKWWQYCDGSPLEYAVVMYFDVFCVFQWAPITILPPLHPQGQLLQRNYRGLLSYPLFLLVHRHERALYFKSTFFFCYTFSGRNGISRSRFVFPPSPSSIGWGWDGPCIPEAFAKFRFRFILPPPQLFDDSFFWFLKKQKKMESGDCTPVANYTPTVYQKADFFLKCSFKTRTTGFSPPPLHSGLVFFLFFRRKSKMFGNPCISHSSPFLSPIPKSTSFPIVSDLSLSRPDFAD